MSLLKEFRAFAMRGNVVDLAVGVIIGAAFGKIVTSVVEDLLMPPVGRLLGNLDFSNLYVPLAAKVPWGLSLVEAKKLGPVLAWGNFVTIAINFVIVAFCIFLLVKGINTLRKQEEAKPAAPPAPTTEEKLLTEIRDLLKAK